MKALAAAFALILALPTSASAAFPGQNGLIAFTRHARPSSSVIKTVDPRTRTIRTLIRAHEGTPSQPAWSPDGTRVVFMRTQPGTDRRSRPRTSIVVADASGRGARVLARNASEPAWSPDGSRIAYTHAAGIWVMNADGSKQRPLLETLVDVRRRVGSPAWSPDGRSVAYVAGGFHLSSLAIATLGGSVRIISRTVFGPADWTPDGRLIFSNDFSLTTAEPDGSNVVRLGLMGQQPTWAPDGTAFAYLMYGGNAGPVGRAIKVADAAGRSVRELTNPPTHPDLDPDWQPRCTRYGGRRGDVLRGTNRFDLLCGLGGNDTVVGGRGSDRLFGEEGNDRFLARDGEFDVVGCGPGWDSVTVDQQDLVGRDCEVVQKT
jgi:TolB protein